MPPIKTILKKVKDITKIIKAVDHGLLRLSSRTAKNLPTVISLLNLLNTHQIKYTPLKGDNDAVNNILHFLSMSSL